MYVGNILTNLVLVNKFLETDEYSIYGLGVLRDLLFGRTWIESGNFPRVTLVCSTLKNAFKLLQKYFQCDFEVRVLGNNQRHSVQCVLVINIFNEKIFILIWLWFTLLFVASTLDMLYWFSISMFHRDRFRFVLRHLELTSDPDKPELFRKEKRKQVEHFLRTYLKVSWSFFKNDFRIRKKNGSSGRRRSCPPNDCSSCWRNVLYRNYGCIMETIFKSTPRKSN